MYVTTSELGQELIPLPAPPLDTAVRDALRAGQSAEAVRLAVQRGNRNENQLTDMVFYGNNAGDRRLKGGRRLKLENPRDRAFIQEWLSIRDLLVRPLIADARTARAPHAPTGWEIREVQSHPGKWTPLPDRETAELGEVTASRVSCEGLPRTYPIFRAMGTDDPLGVLGSAEARAVEMLTGVIDELSRIQREVRSGATPAPPLFSSQLAHAMRARLRLDATNGRVWTRRGPGTAEIMIRWYTNVRSIATAVKYVCLGPDCEQGEWAYTRPTTRRRTIFLCRPFWSDSLDNRALTIIHELAHLYYLRGGHKVETGAGAGNVNCLEQFVADFHGVTVVRKLIGACRASTS